MARQLLARLDADATAGTALDGLAADRPYGAVLAERLRFGPPETWLGWRAGVGRVVLKLWPPDMAPRPLIAVEHAGIAPLLDQGVGWRLFAWVPGCTLAAALRTGTVPVQAAVQIAEAIGALHASGQAHGDLNPANVVIGPAGAVLIDWGEECAGTDGWRPECPHHARERDVFGLRRLVEAICGRQAGQTPATERPCAPDRG